MSDYNSSSRVDVSFTGR